MLFFFFFFQAEDGIRDDLVTGVQTCALPIFDHAVLAEVAGLEPRALRDGLREAVENHIVVVEGDRYAIRHALLREAVHDDLLPGERVELHRALARALESRHDEPGRPEALRTAAIAHH